MYLNYCWMISRLCFWEDCKFSDELTRDRLLGCIMNFTAKVFILFLQIIKTQAAIFSFVRAKKKRHMTWILIFFIPFIIFHFFIFLLFSVFLSLIISHIYFFFLPSSISIFIYIYIYISHPHTPLKGAGYLYPCDNVFFSFYRNEKIRQRWCFLPLFINKDIEINNQIELYLKFG